MVKKPGSFEAEWTTEARRALGRLQRKRALASREAGGLLDLAADTYYRNDVSPSLVAEFKALVPRVLIGSSIAEWERAARRLQRRSRSKTPRPPVLSMVARR